MVIHHLRNATFVIEWNNNFIIIDPMLCDKGKLPPFSMIRHKPRLNPTVALPENASGILEKATHCLITHSRTFGIKALQHTDHLDSPGEAFLRKRNIPVVCPAKDAAYLKKYQINVELSLEYLKPEKFLDGTITAIAARHGHGWISRLMANGCGFYLELPGTPSIYISGDTVYTPEVHEALTRLKPDISVMAAGSARLDFGGPILMTMEELIKFVRKAPGKVIANHLEALNHCPTKRGELKKRLEENGLLFKTLIPEDGETLSF